MRVSWAERAPRTSDGIRSRTARTTRIAGLVSCVALLIVSCSSTSGPTVSSPVTTTTATGAPKSPALNSIDPTAFQAVVEAAVHKLLVPGAVVLLKTPQGTFHAFVGTTKLGERTPPDANTHFRIA